MWASAPTVELFPGTFDEGVLIPQTFGRAMRVIYGGDGNPAGKWPYATTAPTMRGRCAARADEGIGPYG